MNGEPDSVGKWLAGNAAWLASLSLAIFVIVRILVVSRMSIATAQEIARSSSVPGIALATVVENTPQVLYLLAVSVVMGAVGAANVRSWRRWTALTSLAVLALTILATTDWPSGVLLFAALVLCLWALSSDARFRKYAAGDRGTISPALAVALAAPLVITLLMNLFDPDPWIPRERVTYGAGRTVAGFVLASSDGWTTILVDRDRSIVRILTAELRVREPCRAGGATRTPSVVQWVMGTKLGSPYPKCPKG